MGRGEQHPERGGQIPERRPGFRHGPARRLPGVGRQYEGSSRLHQSRLTPAADEDLDAVQDAIQVFLTTQYLEEADRLAGRIAVLDGGRLIAEGTAAELKRRVTAQRLDLTCSEPQAFAKVSGYLGERAVHLDPASRTVGLATDGSAAHIRAVLDETDPGRVLIASFAVHGATLDDVFLALTGHAAKETSHA